MATDSTELTFVRCPSCRSLVPAVSTRCRMCGAGLDASAKAEDDAGDDSKSQRVRQKTMSAPDNEMSSTVGKIRENPAYDDDNFSESEEDAEAADFGAEDVESLEDAGDDYSERNGVEAAGEDAEQDDDVMDPLGGIMEESYEEEVAVVDVDEDAGDMSFLERGAESANAGDESSGEEEDVVDPLGDFLDEPTEEVVILPDEPRAAAWETPPAETYAVADDLPEESAGVVEEAPAEKKTPKVLIESGPRKMNRGGLNFGKPREERIVSMEEKRPAWSQPDAAQAEPQRSAAPETAHNFTSGGTVNTAASGSEQTAAISSPSPTPYQGAVAGRLYGWLVSYSSSEGQAIEIREGKVFITSAALKGNDLILEDESISTPHCMLAVSAQSGFQVQDLMSERGVFLRRRGAETYKREYEAFMVAHGDWLRFGDVEFLVSIIPHVGEE